jgi:hypothetical protein
MWRWNFPFDKELMKKGTGVQRNFANFTKRNGIKWRCLNYLLADGYTRHDLSARILIVWVFRGGSIEQVKRKELRGVTFTRVHPLLFVVANLPCPLIFIANQPAEPCSYHHSA